MRLYLDHSPELVDEVLNIPLKKLKPGSGHAGNDYSAGWIGDLAMTRLPIDVVDLSCNYPNVGLAVLRLWDFLGHMEFHLQQLMVNRLGPRSKLNEHRDGLSDALRFHLPVITNDGVEWWDQLDGPQRMRPFVWYGPVHYAGILHKMKNNGNSARYHLVADFLPPE